MKLQAFKDGRDRQKPGYSLEQLGFAAYWGTLSFS